MDAVRNPFAPGAGSQPPELVGRDEIIRDVDTALQRVLRGRHDKSQILLGLRGTGKTVLLNKIQRMAEHHGHITALIEAPEDKSLQELLYPRLQQALRRLSDVEAAKALAQQALRALHSFAIIFNLRIGDYSISVDPEAGVADSGNLEYDLSDVFERVGEAAEAAGLAWTLLIDEVQYLSKEELSALIVAIHKVNQRQLPILFFGAGLPQIAGLAGNAKSYSERLFSFPEIGRLGSIDASRAIRQPIEEESEEITDVALERIVSETQGYPYFLQEWGFQAWDVTDESPIEVTDIVRASEQALGRLDASFFRVRFDRLTPKEREYVFAMSALGDGPYRSADVADEIGERPQSLGPRRAKIINKGMIYSPAHGDIDFTVPMFADYLRRIKAQMDQ